MNNGEFKIFLTLSKIHFQASAVPEGLRFHWRAVFIVVGQNK